MIKHIAVWLVNWLCHKFDLPIIPNTRIMCGSDAVERGARWQNFYYEKGGMGDFIAAIRRGYFEAAAGLSATEHDKIYEYALADRIAREIERQALSIVQTGKIEAERLEAEARSRIIAIKR